MPDADMEPIDAVRQLATDDERWRSTRRPLLAVLLASQRPVSVGRVMELLGDDVPTDESAMAEALHTDFSPWVIVSSSDGVQRYLLRDENVRELAIRTPDDLVALLGEEFVKLNRHVFRRLIPDEGGSSSWKSLDEYAIHSLPGFAFGAREQLMMNPDFVQCCEPAAILRYANQLHDPDARRVAVALECTLGHVEDRS